MLSMLNAASLANSAELTSNNVLTGGLFDKINGLKASWDKTLELGDHSTNLKTTYKHDGHDGNLDLTFTGEIASASYEVNYDLSTKDVAVKLSTDLEGTKVTLDSSADGMQEVAVERDVSVAGFDLTVQPSWMVKAQSARVQLMTKLGGSDDVTVAFDYADGDVSNAEVSESASLERAAPSGHCAGPMCVHEVVLTASRPAPRS